MIALAGIFFAVQLGEAFIQKGTWPLSTFSMYSEPLIKNNHEVLLEITLKNGKKLYEIPIHTLPIYYYKHLIFLRKTFYDKDSPYYQKKDTYIKMFLKYTELENQTSEVNVYSVALKDIKKDNYHWDHFKSSSPPLYTYINHDK